MASLRVHFTGDYLAFTAMRVALQEIVKMSEEEPFNAGLADAAMIATAGLEVARRFEEAEAKESGDDPNAG